MLASVRIRCLLVAATMLAAVACGSTGDDGGATPDGAVELDCDSAGGDVFDLTVGTMEAGTSFVELVDGDDLTLILGAQGLYMIHLESRAALSVADEQICLACVLGVGPTDAGFPGISQDGPVAFSAMEAEGFGAGTNIILGSPQESDQYADSQVEVTMQCSGHGFSGSAAHLVTLRRP